MQSDISEIFATHSKEFYSYEYSESAGATCALVKYDLQGATLQPVEQFYYDPAGWNENQEGIFVYNSSPIDRETFSKKLKTIASAMSSVLLYGDNIWNIGFSDYYGDSSWEGVAFAKGAVASLTYEQAVAYLRGYAL